VGLHSEQGHCSKTVEARESDKEGSNLLEEEEGEDKNKPVQGPATLRCRGERAAGQALTKEDT
jgi:hypothetical protein